MLGPAAFIQHLVGLPQLSQSTLSLSCCWGSSSIMAALVSCMPQQSHNTLRHNTDHRQGSAFSPRFSPVCDSRLLLAAWPWPRPGIMYMCGFCNQIKQGTHQETILLILLLVLLLILLLVLLLVLLLILPLMLLLLLLLCLLLAPAIAVIMFVSPF